MYKLRMSDAPLTEGERSPVITKNILFMLQSGNDAVPELDTAAPVADTQDHEVVEFIDENPAIMNTVEEGGDNSFYMAGQGDDSVQGFFSRPVQIDQITWGIGNAFNTVIDPWSAWGTSKRVMNRLNNFQNFRGTMHVKFVINGNQFYWGRIIASYFPGDTAEFDVANSLVGISQLPHTWLDASSNAGSEMVVPLIIPQNCHNMTGPNPFDDLGVIVLAGVTGLHHATSSAPITITVYAWVEDVHLSGPTHKNITGLVPQSGKISKGKGKGKKGSTSSNAGSEYGSGPLSRPASIVASMAGKLTGVPFIGQYALATQMAAGTAGSIASMFGFSRPAIIDIPEVNRPLPAGNLANVDAPDTSMRLALTSKQEITIDPRTVGLDDADELAFAYIAAKESIIGVVPWLPAKMSGDVIFSTKVSPMMYNEITVDGTQGYDMTPTAFVALPFRYWCGSMTYRFQIVASGFHKGRLKFVWDSTDGASPFDTEDNLARTVIVDIAEERDFTMEIGWGNHNAGLEVPTLTTTPWSATTVQTANLDFYNGVLSVYVVNEMVSSSTSTEPIEIIVSCSSRDLNVWAPDEEDMADLSWFPQPLPDVARDSSSPPLPVKSPGFIPQRFELQSGTEPSEMTPMPEGQVVTVVGAGDAGTAAEGILAGEHITSFRQCMKRYCAHSLQSFPRANNAVTLHTHRSGAFPYYRGMAPGAIDEDVVTGKPVNICSMTMINYVSAAYWGFRGSIRWKFIPFRAPCCNWHFSVARCGGDCSYEDVWSEAPFESTTEDGNPRFPTQAVRAAFVADLGTGWDGVATTSTQHNPVLEVELPWQSNRRFARVTANRTNAPSNGFGYRLKTSIGPYIDKSVSSSTGYDSSNSTDYLTLQTYCSIGEDFQLFFFSSVPRIFRVII